ncbi:ChbG/HpnK family deacetylase [Epibacterium ulvae]|uniref:ChbG/HpnK family deacetylase n=1 Tax=Epibacterium ulvae TaxID=1156985 RepID=UPI001BFC43EE|nr:ChbG/HpnK family deacetylase [Epibacterium ulvae]MBT8154363.1 ChbG/HpnK family deacetylase [Epibacterium ulvae]
MMHFTLCADDFGLHQGTDDGIIELIQAGRLNAVSCMSVGSTLNQNAGRLLQAATDGRVKIGLHLTFTEYAPVGLMPHLAPDGVLPSIGTLIQQAHMRKLRKLRKEEISEQIARQLRVFTETFGRFPDFIDGHQHAHILPVIRDAVIATVLSMPRGVWVRSCDLPLPQVLSLGVATRRAVVISTLARQLKRALLRHRVPTNAVFYGVNDFDPDQDFGDMMRIWLDAARTSRKPALIMCHPGYPKTTDVWDPIAARRPDELSYLASEQFGQDMVARDLTLVAQSDATDAQKA